jgi:hypothetical protein
LPWAVALSAFQADEALMEPKKAEEGNLDQCFRLVRLLYQHCGPDKKMILALPALRDD